MRGKATSCFVFSRRQWSEIFTDGHLLLVRLQFSEAMQEIRAVVLNTLQAYSVGQEKQRGPMVLLRSGLGAEGQVPSVTLCCISS